MKCSEGVVRDFVLISWTKNTTTGVGNKMGKFSGVN